MYRPSGQCTTPSLPVSLSQGDSPREKNLGKVCTGSQGNGLHAVRQSAQVRETVQEKRTWERYVQALRAIDYTQYASQFKSGRQSKRKEQGKGTYRPSGKWSTPRMPVSSSQGDSPREKNMGKVCTDPQGNGLHPVCQSFQVRGTVQEKVKWEKVCTGSQGVRLHTVCQSVQVREQSKRKEHGKGMYRPSGQWTTPSMPVISSQGDSPRERNMGKVCTGSQGVRLHTVCQSVQVREQSKRKQHGKGMYRPSGRWTTPSMPVSSSQGAVEEKRTWERYVQALRMMDYTQYASQFKSGSSPREKNMGKVCTGIQGVGLNPGRQSVQVRETVEEKREKNMGKVCTGPQGNGLNPVCHSVLVRETVQEKDMYRLSGQWTTPSMPVSVSQGDSPRE